MTKDIIVSTAEFVDYLVDNDLISKEDLYYAYLDYGVFDIDNNCLYALGISYHSGDRFLSYKYNIGQKKVTDKYEIYNKGKHVSSEISIDTEEYVCHYYKYPTHEDKVCAITGKVLQQNFQLDSNKVPKGALDKVKYFEYLPYVYGYSEKPYGRMLEFSVPNLATIPIGKSKFYHRKSKTI